MKKKIVLLLILVLSIFCIAATGCVTNQVDETVVLTEENASLVFSKVADPNPYPPLSIPTPTPHSPPLFPFSTSYPI